MWEIALSTIAMVISGQFIKMIALPIINFAVVTAMIIDELVGKVCCMSFLAALMGCVIVCTFQFAYKYFAIFFIKHFIFKNFLYLTKIVLCFTFSFLAWLISSTANLSISLFLTDKVTNYLVFMSILLFNKKKKIKVSIVKFNQIKKRKIYFFLSFFFLSNF